MYVNTEGRCWSELRTLEHAYSSPEMLQKYGRVPTNDSLSSQFRVLITIRSDDINCIEKKTSHSLPYKDLLSNGDLINFDGFPSFCDDFFLGSRQGH